MCGVWRIPFRHPENYGHGNCIIFRMLGKLLAMWEARCFLFCFCVPLLVYIFFIINFENRFCAEYLFLFSDQASNHWIMIIHSFWIYLLAFMLNRCSNTEIFNSNESHFHGCIYRIRVIKINKIQYWIRDNIFIRLKNWRVWTEYYLNRLYVYWHLRIISAIVNKRKWHLLAMQFPWISRLLVI